MPGRFSVEAVFKAVDRVTAPVSRMQKRVGKFTKGMERGFRRLDRQIGKFSSGLKTGIGALGVGVGAVTASVGLLLREFSKVENAEAAFTPLIGGAKKAKQLVAEINETAASTPFQFETLADAVNQLLPVMDGNIKDTIKTVRMLGDTAGGNAQKLDSITRGFTKAMLKGKVDLESLNMIGEAGVPIFKDLASVMGTEVNAAFFKMISAGKVTTTDLTKAFKRMTSEGGVFFNGMEIASKTTTGMFSTLKDNISLTAATLGSTLAPVAKEIIGRMTEMSKTIRELIVRNRELISVKVKEYFMFIVDNFQSIVKWGKRIGTAIVVFIALATVLKTFIAIMTAVNLVMALNPIGLVILGLVALGAAFAALVALIIVKWEPIKAFFADLWDTALAGFNFFIDSVMGALNTLKSAFAGIGETFKKVGGFFGFGDSEDDETETGGNGAGPQVVSPQDRVARSIEEKKTTSTAEVTIKDESGRAEITGGKMGPGLKLQSTGAF